MPGARYAGKKSYASDAKKKKKPEIQIVSKAKSSQVDYARVRREAFQGKLTPLEEAAIATMTKRVEARHGAHASIYGALRNASHAERGVLARIALERAMKDAIKTNNVGQMQDALTAMNQGLSVGVPGGRPISVGSRPGAGSTGGVGGDPLPVAPAVIREPHAASRARLPAAARVPVEVEVGGGGDVVPAEGGGVVPRGDVVPAVGGGGGYFSSARKLFWEAMEDFREYAEVSEIVAEKRRKETEAKRVKIVDPVQPPVVGEEEASPESESEPEEDDGAGLPGSIVEVIPDVPLREREAEKEEEPKRKRVAKDPEDWEIADEKSYIRKTALSSKKLADRFKEKGVITKGYVQAEAPGGFAGRRIKHLRETKGEGDVDRFMYEINKAFLNRKLRKEREGEVADNLPRGPLPEEFV